MKLMPHLLCGAHTSITFRLLINVFLWLVNFPFLITFLHPKMLLFLAIQNSILSLSNETNLKIKS